MDFVGNRETLNSGDVQAVVRSVWSEDINQMRSSEGHRQQQKNQHEEWYPTEHRRAGSQTGWRGSQAEKGVSKIM